MQQEQQDGLHDKQDSQKEEQDELQDEQDRLEVQSPQLICKWVTCGGLVMATLAKQKRTKASIMVFSLISKRSEYLRY
jgi:hypothetical protein